MTLYTIDQKPSANGGNVPLLFSPVCLPGCAERVSRLSSVVQWSGVRVPRLSRTHASSLRGTQVQALKPHHAVEPMRGTRNHETAGLWVSFTCLMVRYDVVLLV